MYLQILALAVQLQTTPAAPNLHQLRSWPSRYADKEVVVCGTKVVEEHGRVFLYDYPHHEAVAVMLAKQVMPVFHDGSICVSGRFGRVDGLSYEEGKRKYGVRIIADAPADTTFWIY